MKILDRLFDCVTTADLAPGGGLKPLGERLRMRYPRLNGAITFSDVPRRVPLPKDGPRDQEERYAVVLGEGGIRRVPYASDDADAASMRAYVNWASRPE